MSRKQRIHTLLSEQLTLVYLNVEDESPGHHVPVDGETHFKVVIVSPLFENQSRVFRHRKVLKLLDAEFQAGLHALSLHLYTPVEWQKKSAGAPPSPPCNHRQTGSWDR
ncbi:MAG: BolA family transcriptional regulator [Legionellales bacterium]|nr:BolA family transcriptional regulator [Legionellales bacterium]